MGIKSHCGRADKSGMLFVDNEGNEARTSAHVCTRLYVMVPMNPFYAPNIIELLTYPLPDQAFFT